MFYLLVSSLCLLLGTTFSRLSKNICNFYSDHVKLINEKTCYLSIPVFTPRNKVFPSGLFKFYFVNLNKSFIVYFPFQSHIFLAKVISRHNIL